MVRHASLMLLVYMALDYLCEGSLGGNVSHVSREWLNKDLVL